MTESNVLSARQRLGLPEPNALGRDTPSKVTTFYEQFLNALRTVDENAIYASPKILDEPGGSSPAAAFDAAIRIRLGLLRPDNDMASSLWQEAFRNQEYAELTRDQNAIEMGLYRSLREALDYAQGDPLSLGTPRNGGGFSMEAELSNAPGYSWEEVIGADVFNDEWLLVSRTGDPQDNAENVIPLPLG